MTLSLLFISIINSNMVPSWGYCICGGHVTVGLCPLVLGSYLGPFGKCIHGTGSKIWRNLWRSMSLYVASLWRVLLVQQCSMWCIYSYFGFMFMYCHFLITFVKYILNFISCTQNNPKNTAILFEPRYRISWFENERRRETKVTSHAMGWCPQLLNIDFLLDNVREMF